jgi:small multidrug resistance family-3 protein
MKTFLLFFITALAEILGCYLSYAVIRQGKHTALLIAAAICLWLFAWLLTLHPTGASGRLYAAYGGVYIAASMLWLWRVEGISLDRWDFIGATTCLLGAAIIILPTRSLTP